MGMELQIGSNLKFICSELVEECGRKGFEDAIARKRFMRLLQPLNGTEKYLIAKKFSKIPWNIGSLKVLGVLHELKTLSPSEFFQSVPSEDIELILNDFYEDEFQLLNNLFLTIYFSSCLVDNMKMSQILDASLQSLYSDLLKDPTLNDLRYLESLKTLPTSNLEKLTLKHLEVILQLHTSEIKEAFQNFSSWINEGVDQIKFTQVIFDQLIKGRLEEECVSSLLDWSTNENFNNWKFYFIFMQIIASHGRQETRAYIRHYLKAKLKQIAAMPTKTNFLHFLLTARAATAISLDLQKNINAYADWYKQNICDMKFILTSEEFKNMLTIMEECLDYESEPYYIEIHSQLAISPAVLCASLVNSYKNKCKQKFMSIEKGLKQNRDKADHKQANELPIKEPPEAKVNSEIQISASQGEETSILIEDSD